MPLHHVTRRTVDGHTNQDGQASGQTEDKATKCLGVWVKGNGCSMKTGQSRLETARCQIAKAVLPKEGGPTAASTVANAYIVNAIEYALILAKIDLKELNRLDAALIRRLKKHNGLARSDCAIWIMRQVKNMGSGCRSFVDTYLRALIRDMEEVLYNAALQGVIARSSLELCR